MSTVEALRSARALIVRHSRWTRGARARDHRGAQLTSGRDSAAACFCVVGALEAITDDPEAAIRALHEAIPRRDPRWRWLAHGAPLYVVMLYNDEVTHAEVLALFEHAIDREETKRCQALAALSSEDPSRPALAYNAMALHAP